MAAEGAGAEGGSSSGTTTLEAGGSWEAVPENGHPHVPSFKDSIGAECDQVRRDMHLTASSVLEGLPFQWKCGLMGVAPHESGLCVETTAGPGGDIVRMHSNPQPARSSAISSSMLCKRDEVFSRRLQQEKDNLATHTAAHTWNVKNDAHLGSFYGSPLNISSTKSPVVKAAPGGIS